jgi:hypothetical protein
MAHDRRPRVAKVGMRTSGRVTCGHRCRRRASFEETRGRAERGGTPFEETRGQVERGGDPVRGGPGSGVALYLPGRDGVRPSAAGKRPTIGDLGSQKLACAPRAGWPAAIIAGVASRSGRPGPCCGEGATQILQAQAMISGSAGQPIRAVAIFAGQTNESRGPRLISAGRAARSRWPGLLSAERAAGRSGGARLQGL